MSDTTPGREEMVVAVAIAMATHGPSVDAPLAEKIVDALIAKGGGPDHILRVKNGVWTLQHPLDERFSGNALFECRYNIFVDIAWGQGAFGRNGNHRLWIDAGVLMWEEVA